LGEPWNEDIRGTQVLALINQDAPIIRVEAGPGTGKTFGLVRRVQRIVHPEGLGVAGHEVLIVAFNRVIAKQLKADIDTRLHDVPEQNRPIIRTVHALCLTLIRSEVRLLLPHERDAMLYDVLCLYPALQTQYETHAKAEQALRDHEAKHQEHTTLWQAVRQWLIRHKAQLISDLPGLVLDKLDGGDLRDHLYRHMLVDEFQDLTAGEQRLFFRLRHPEGQFLALGDSRQSIYLFRGNEREGLAKLDQMAAGPIRDISMTECHRCPPPLVAAANQLMGLSSAPPMVPGTNERANLHVVTWTTPDTEASGMAQAIVNNYRANPRSDSPNNPNTHLVMVTRRQFGFKLREKIKEIAPDLTVDLSFSESLLETWPVREAFLFFCLLVDPDTPTWRAWLGYKNSLTGKDFKAPKRNAPAYLNVLDEHHDEITETVVRELAGQPRTRPRGEGGTCVWDRASRFVTLNDSLQWDGRTAFALIQEVFNSESNHWISDQTEHPETARMDMQLVLDKSMAMLAEQEPDEEHTADVTAQLRRIARILRYQIATREPFVPGESADIHVSTLWGAKGVTATHVYVIGLCAETMPGTKREEYPGTESDYFDEQRRLFYVSLTRSTRTLVLSRPLSILKFAAARLGITANATGSSPFARLAICPFLRDIIRYLPSAQTGDHWGGCC
jgi:DNA helicase-2/ATP-dependent DNA helicase PcrA